MAKSKLWGFMKKPLDLINRGFNYKADDNTNTTQVTNKQSDDGINISRLNDLVVNQMYTWDSTIMDFEYKKDQAVINLPKLISKYRELADESEIEEAVSIITEEAIFPDTDNEIVNLDLTDFIEEYNENIAETIRESFEKIIGILKFEREAYKYFRDWYIDGRIAFEAVYNEDRIEDGIQDIIQIDPIKLKKFHLRDQNKTFYELEEVDYENGNIMSGMTGFSNSSVNKTYNTRKVLMDDRFITYVNSGQFNKHLNVYVSYLHPAMKKMNQLKMLKMSILIYRLSRAPERRAIYIDTTGLSTTKAEQHIDNIINKFKNSSTFDPSSNNVINRTNVMEITKDFFIPIDNGSANTRIESLPGAANLGELNDIDIFRIALYKSLKIPMSRWDDQSSSYTMGRVNEISQEEQRFTNFIRRLKVLFADMLYDLLIKDCLSQKIFSIEEVDKIKKLIKIKWNKKNYFDEMLEQEILKSRIEVINQMEPLIGKYFTHEDVFIGVLKYDDEKMREVAKKNGLDLDNLSLMDKEAEDVSGAGGTDDFGGGDFGGGDFAGDEDFGEEEDFGDEDFGEEEFSLDDFDEEGEEGEEPTEEEPEI